MNRLRSLTIRAAGYDASNRTMKIEFSMQRILTYCSVPPEVFEGLLEATSKKEYFEANIRGKYAC
ncbi:KTSC domain-containing protein [Desulfogranum japonicum]|uniref:KTSC domain-containing protein n=1 Tax=Desulfogranum japonicum TaxID=231447 RepID=UPI00137680C1|nr:KTSC domain-containing protein [Desulfogranum japonicum]